PPSRFPPFPYTTLFRSLDCEFTIVQSDDTFRLFEVLTIICADGLHDIPEEPLRCNVLICADKRCFAILPCRIEPCPDTHGVFRGDRKSTRLNSSHVSIS